MYPDPYLTGTWTRIGQLNDFQYFRTAELVKTDSSHVRANNAAARLFLVPSVRMVLTRDARGAATAVSRGLPTLNSVNIGEFAASGPLLLAAGVAVAAGAVSFASPCVIPLVPGYLAYLAGLIGAEAPATDAGQPVQRGRWRVAGAAGLFVLGYTAIFVAGSASLFGLIDALQLGQDLLQRIGGVVTIVMALAFLGLIPVLQRTGRFTHRPHTGLLGALLLGAVFALGWTPCIGPTLSGVLSLTAGTEIGPASLRGVLLMLLYCLGLGVPFVLIALGTRWAVRATGWLRRHVRGVQITGGVMLLAVGVLLVTGLWGEVVDWLRSMAANGVTVPL